MTGSFLALYCNNQGGQLSARKRLPRRRVDQFKTAFPGAPRYNVILRDPTQTESYVGNV